MKTSYVTLKPTFLQPGHLKAQVGDILVFDASTDSLTIFRDQKIVETRSQSKLGIAGMKDAGFIKPVENPTESPANTQTDTAPEVPAAGDSTETLTTVQQIEEKLIVAALKVEGAVEDAATELVEKIEGQAEDTAKDAIEQAEQGPEKVTEQVEGAVEGQLTEKVTELESEATEKVTEVITDATQKVKGSGKKSKS